MNDRKEENLKIICRYLPQYFSELLKNLEKERIHKLCEIRIRAEKPAVLIFTDESLFITRSGRLTCFLSNDLMRFTRQETESVFNSLCRYSVHSLTDSIARGFITLEGGSRVGVYGTAVTDGDRIVSVRSISGLNIRVSGNFTGIAESAAETIYSKGCANTLICGPPSSGKTTFLKDLCRILSDNMGKKVCIVDERGETDGCMTGINTDVLSGYPKAEGVRIAVRTLSPDIIAFDEIGTLSEAEAVSDGLNSGVMFIMTMHCENTKELMKKPQFRYLKGCGAADSIVLLKKTGIVEKIIFSKELEDENCSTDRLGNFMRADRTVYSLQAYQARHYP